MDCLLTRTPDDWAPFALGDLDAFLLDHASCERKASAVGLSFVVRYPDQTLLLEPMIRFAREELHHFHQVYKLIQARGLQLRPDEPDTYVNRLMEQVRFGREERLMDRLIVSSLIEARGCERLGLVARHLEEPSLKHFYSRLARAEGHHQGLFLRLACALFPESEVQPRWEALRVEEARAISSVPYRHALH